MKGSGCCNLISKNINRLVGIFTKGGLFMTPFEKTVLAIIKSGLYGGPAGPLPGQQAEQNTKQNAPQNTAPGLVLDSAFN